MNIVNDNTCKDNNRGNIKIDKLNKIIKFTVLFSLTVIPLIILPIETDIDKYYFPKVAAMLIIVISFLIMKFTNKWRINYIIKGDITNKILLLYLLSLIVSTFFAFNKAYAVFGSPGRYEGIITICLYMILFLISRLYINVDEKLFKIILISAAVVSGYGILQTFGIEPFPRDADRINWVNAFSTIGNPNFLGSYLVLMIPISVYLFIVDKSLLGMVGYIILFYCLLGTNTRGAWLGYIVSIIAFTVIHFIYFRYSKAEFRRYVILFIATLVILLLFNFKTGGALLNRFLTISLDAKELLTDGEKADLTGSHRGFIWKRVIELIKQRPITGYGLENLGEMFVKYYSQDMIEFWGKVRYPDKAHNEYLHIAVTSGIPSLMIYLSFLTIIITNGLKKLANNKLLLLLLSSVIGYMAAAFFNISIVSVAYIYWIFLGLIASYNYQ